MDFNFQYLFKLELNIKIVHLFAVQMWRDIVVIYLLLRFL